VRAGRFDLQRKLELRHRMPSHPCRAQACRLTSGKSNLDEANEDGYRSAHMGTHGQDAERWAKAKGKVCATLVERARHRGFITYSELAKNVSGVPMPGEGWSSNLAWLLGQVLMEEIDAGRPLLPALAVRKQEGSPGMGFYQAAGDAGVGDGTQSEALWVREFTKAHRFYEADKH